MYFSMLKISLLSVEIILNKIIKTHFVITQVRKHIGGFYYLVLILFWAVWEHYKRSKLQGSWFKKVWVRI